MGQLTVLVRSPDRRVVTPTELLADPDTKKGSLTPGGAKELSDDVSGELVRLMRGREPWRQTYAEQLHDRVGNWLRPSRWPIESTPEVRLAGSAMAEGLYVVAGRCRHVLYRDPDAEPLSAATVSRPLATGESSDFRLPSYVAGYVPPDSINAAWEAATAYAPGQSIAYDDPKGSWVESSNPIGQLLFECTTAGTSGAVEPEWPLSLAEWAPSAPYAAEAWVDPRPSALIFEPTTPGTSAASEPDWPTSAGETVTDGTVTWTAREAMEIVDGTVTWTGRNAKPFPRTIRKAALLLARMIRSIDRNGECEGHEEKMKMVKKMLAGAC